MKRSAARDGTRGGNGQRRSLFPQSWRQRRRSRELASYYQRVEDALARNFSETLRQLELRGPPPDVIDISRPRVNLTTWSAWRSNVFTLARLIRDILKRIGRSDIGFVNINAGRAWLLASWIWAIYTVLGRPMALRFFGVTSSAGFRIPEISIPRRAQGEGVLGGWSSFRSST